jgi:aerobic carbon-monoxide dehydrogenase small subunit
MTQAKISLTLNDRPVAATVESRTHLADFLRDDQMLTGTHIGCEQGVCGACTVMIDGRPARSCITLAAACDAADVRTIESFDDDPLMARLREAFSRHHGLQCGYCTPGMLATAYDIVRRVPGADADRIRKELSGNLCRCTGYAGAVAAVADVLAHDPPEALLQPMARARRSVAADDGRALRPNMEDGVPPVAAAGGSKPSGIEIPELVANGTALSRNILIEAAPEAVWRIVSDIPTLVACIPGARLSEPMQGRRAVGAVGVALGPIRSSFDGAADIDLNAKAKSGRVVGRGVDRLSRSTLDGSLGFELAGAGNGSQSRLKLEMVYRLKGPLAQFGRPAVVESVADQLLSETAKAIADKAHGRDSGAAADPAPLNAFLLAWIALKGLLRGLWRRP